MARLQGFEACFCLRTPGIESAQFSPLGLKGLDFGTRVDCHRVASSRLSRSFNLYQSPTDLLDDRADITLAEAVLLCTPHELRESPFFTEIHPLSVHLLDRGTQFL